MENSHLTESNLQAIGRLNEMGLKLAKILEKVKAAYEAGNRIPLLKFFYNYVEWNQAFAGSVCSLVSEISKDEYSIFTDDLDQGPLFSRDRGDLVASYIFDAARDEYSSETPEHKSGRWPHRILAHTFLRDLIRHTRMPEEKVRKNEEDTFIDSIFSNYSSQVFMNMHFHKEKIRQNYIGTPHSILREKLLFGMGFHLGSELFADLEFSILNLFLTELLEKKFVWLNAHAGNGDKVEDKHFQHALDGANYAISLVARKRTDGSLIPKNSVTEGFQEFRDTQSLFFQDLSNHIFGN